MELWSVFKVIDKWWRDSVGVKIVGWVGVVGRCARNGEIVGV